jgi:hypothetical protein
VPQLGLDGYDVLALPGSSNYSGYRRFNTQHQRDSVIVLINWDWDREWQIDWPFASAVLGIGVNTSSRRTRIGTGERLSMAPCSAAVWATGAVCGILPSTGVCSRVPGDLS